jgi:hypothetical protein
MNNEDSGTLSDIERKWTKERASYLDSNREPTPPTVRSVLGTLLWFVGYWIALAFLEDRALLTANAAVFCTVVLYSLRWRQFEAAYRTYQKRRALLPAS